jgi:hypothetical protein
MQKQLGWLSGGLLGLLVGILIASPTENALSAGTSGKELQSRCRFYPSAIPSTANCLAYIDGSLEVLRAMRKRDKRKTSCEVESETDDLFYKTFINYLNENFNELQNDATTLIVRVYDKMFACNRASGRITQ